MTTRQLFCISHETYSARLIAHRAKMKGIFGKSSKNPAEIVRNLKDDLNTLEKGGDGKKQEKAQGRIFSQVCNLIHDFN